MGAPNPYTGPWRRIRLRILNRDNWTCRIQSRDCTGRATCVDHIIPWQDGGPWWDDTNLRAACKPCNDWRGRASAPTHHTDGTTTPPSRNW